MHALTLGALALICASCDRRVVKVPTAAMEPTIEAGSYIEVRDISDEERASLRRGQIVVFEYPPQPEVHYLKRIVALGGDEIVIRDHRVILNGEPTAEPFIQVLEGSNWRKDFGPFRVPDGEVFMLGDNRTASADSRVWGTVKLSAIVGVVDVE